MLPSRYRLHSRVEISRTIRDGRRARRGALVVHVQVGDGGADPARAAFAVSKAVGDSVTRHRVVRRLRGVMPPLLDRLPGGSEVVVRAMPEAATATATQLREDLERALERVTPLAPQDSADHRECAPVQPEPPEIRSTTEHSAPDPRRTGIHLLAYWIGWPIRSLLLSLIWVYRHTISPILPPTCRYHPSCSAYGFEALQVHGAAKGTVLTAWRVLRCNPFTPGGLDPVPTRGTWRPDIHPDGTPRVTAHRVA
ncbi:MAG: membrane protein insertion efficiency factor YidD [Candidatus Nanopelagicales bacterium]